MSPLYIRPHGWLGFSLRNAQPDLFHRVFRLGFVTIYVCRTCLLDVIGKLRGTMQAALVVSQEQRARDAEGQDIHR